MTAWPRIVGLFFARDFAIARSYRFAFAFDSLAMVANVAVFFYLAKLVSPERLGGGDELRQGYFAFALVGLTLLGVANACITAFAGQLRSDQTTGTLEAIAATPVPFPLAVLGGGAYAVFRGLVVAAFTLAVGAGLFGFRPVTDASGVATLLVVLAGLAGFTAGAGLIIAALTLVIRQTAKVAGVFTMALTLFSGAYYPLEVLPQPIEAIAEAVPVAWAMEAARDALLGGDVSELALAGLLASAAVALAAGLALVEACLRRAKRRGTLTSY